MNNKAKNKEEEVKQTPYYSNEALLKMTNVLFDPIASDLVEQANLNREAHILSLGRISSSREAHYWASQITRDAGMNPKRTWTLDEVYRVAFLLLSRSINMDAFKLGIGLAGTQAVQETEGVGEDMEW